jgi:opacity protein-like surface antigen
MRSPLRFATPLRPALLVAALLGSALGLAAADPVGRLSVRVGGGILFNLGGRYSDYFKFKDIIDLGGGLNVGLRYEVHRNVYLEAGYGYAVLGIKQQARPFDFRHGNSYFGISAATLGASLYLKSGYPIEPYLTIGGGLYPWQFRSRLFGGNTWPAPANPQTLLKDTSPGLSIGLGAEANLLLNLTATFEIKYIYIFSRDVARYLTDDFTQMDYLGIGVGIIYYFKRK